MKTLYITDLDGTLLNSKAELSNKSSALISAVIDNGGLFTVATARTFATVMHMFEGVNLNLPLVLMNGVMIYDPIERRIISCSSINKNKTAKIFDIYKKHSVYPLVYRNKDKYLEIEYFNTDNQYQMRYVDARADKSGKRFVFSPEFTHIGKDEVVYIVTLDTYEKILPLYEDVSALDGISCAFYRDNYTDCYFLEIFAGGVSKASALSEVKRLIRADKVIAFGDNLNDMELFGAADEAYAVFNACDELKMMATDVIGLNNDDSVAQFIYGNFTENKNE